MSGYPWLRFTVWDVIGESLGAGLYIWLGSIFSDRVQQIATISGDLGWAIAGVVVAVFIGWKLFAGRQR
jgi:membrane protein DedA with SNARE-associated domain